MKRGVVAVYSKGTAALQLSLGKNLSLQSYQYLLSIVSIEKKSNNRSEDLQDMKKEVVEDSTNPQMEIE